uniref:Importin subunit alpha n=1 Tax=Juniperus flaccida TaxID=487036 RepID=A0A3S6N1X1_9CONI|nr:importin alpha isoform 9 [Juniperus flaccida]
MSHMAEESGSPGQRRDSIKTTVGNMAGQRRRQQAVSVGKERRDAVVRAKRLCRVDYNDEDGNMVDTDVAMDDDKASLEDQIVHIVEELKSAVSFTGKGSFQKKMEVLRRLRRLLSQTSMPPVEIAVQAGVVPILVQCLSFGSANEQLLEAAWCLTNIATGDVDQTRALLPALPLLIAHLGEKSSIPVAEQCAWALGNVAGEGEEFRDILLAQGALPPLARLLLSNKGSTSRTAAWALSNLIKGPKPKAAAELINMSGIPEAIVRHMQKGDEELATEVAWVVVYLTALSEMHSGLLIEAGLLPPLVGRLASSDQLSLLTPVLRSIGNLVAGDNRKTDAVLAAGNDIPGSVVGAMIRCLESQHRTLKKEAAWALSNIAAGTLVHKQLIFSSGAVSSLLHLLVTATFDIRKEVAYVLGNLCVSTVEETGESMTILEHLTVLVNRRCLPGFINLIKSPDIEAAKLGLQFLELVMRSLPNDQGPKLVENEDGIAAMELFQFHENEEIRNMANGLVDKYFGENYGIEEEY